MNPFKILVKSNLLSDQQLGVVRHILTLVAGVLIGLGIIHNVNDVNSVVDTIMNFITSVNGVVAEFLTVISLIGSWFSKQK